MANHTPGPWELRKHNYGNYRDAIGVFRVGSNTAIVDGVWGRNLTESDTNARLIAAAPDLLEALKLMLHTFGDSDDRSVIESAAAAMFKAEGRS
jgi:hypothetical protein